MRTSADPGISWPANSLLALGYHRTLQPDPAFHTTATNPPQLSTLLDSLLAAARTQLDHRLPPTQQTFNGEAIPIASLLINLQQRLQDILTLPLANHLSTASSPYPITSAYLTREHPALAPLLTQSISEFVTSTITFILRLREDAPRLAHWLGMPMLPPIESLTATASDTHPGGHPVLQVLFRGGTGLYYKPRPVTGEWLWHALLQSVTTADPDLQLQAARVLPGRNPHRYGWMESLSSRSEPPSPRYWKNAGAILCLAHHVRLTDLHFENILATPLGPAVVDAECLASPTFARAKALNSIPSAQSIASLLQSMAATGLLPASRQSTAPEVSGFFARPNQAHGISIPQWSRLPDGSYCLIPIPATLLHHDSVPVAPSPLAVLPHLLAGYRQAATALMQARKSLLARDSSWLATLQKFHAPRVVLRDTLTYALLLTQSLHPTCLCSVTRRRAILLHALRQVSPQGFPQSVLRAELQALFHLHVPRLTLLPGSRTLASASGRPLASGFAAVSPASQIIGAIQSLTLSSLESTLIPALLLALLR
jgi:lantibiotic modifying enzyme